MSIRSAPHARSTTRLLLAMLGVVVAVTTIATPVAAAPGPDPDPDRESHRRWLALGDSYSSGEGIADTPETRTDSQWPRDDEAKAGVSRDCRRASGSETDATAWAPGAYRLVADDLGLGALDFVACTGATSWEVRSQLREVRQTTGNDWWDVVSFSMGGNDILFADIITDCLDLEVGQSWRDWFIGDSGCSVTLDQVRARIDMLVGRRAPEQGEYVGITLPAMYDLVADHVVPGGDVIVVGYPNVIEDPSRWGLRAAWPPTRRPGRIGSCAGILGEDAQLLRDAAAYLNSQIAEAVQAADDKYAASGIRFHFIDIAKDPYESSDAPSDRHALCTAEPWINGVTIDINNDGAWAYRGRSFHPNQLGYTATATVVADYVRKHVRFDDKPKPPPESADAEQEDEQGTDQQRPPEQMEHILPTYLEPGRIYDIAAPDCSFAVQLHAAPPEGGTGMGRMKQAGGANCGHMWLQMLQGDNSVGGIVIVPGDRRWHSVGQSWADLVIDFGLSFKRDGCIYDYYYQSDGHLSGIWKRTGRWEGAPPCEISRTSQWPDKEWHPA